jgi:hypothetical protein
MSGVVRLRCIPLLNVVRCTEQSKSAAAAPPAAVCGLMHAAVRGSTAAQATQAASVMQYAGPAEISATRCHAESRMTGTQHDCLRLKMEVQQPCLMALSQGVLRLAPPALPVCVVRCRPTAVHAAHMLHCTDAPGLSMFEPFLGVTAAGEVHPCPRPPAGRQLCPLPRRWGQDTCQEGPCDWEHNNHGLWLAFCFFRSFACTPFFAIFLFAGQRIPELSGWRGTPPPYPGQHPHLSSAPPMNLPSGSRAWLAHPKSHLQRAAGARGRTVGAAQCVYVSPLAPGSSPPCSFLLLSSPVSSWPATESQHATGFGAQGGWVGGYNHGHGHGAPSPRVHVTLFSVPGGPCCFAGSAVPMDVSPPPTHPPEGHGLCGPGRFLKTVNCHKTDAHQVLGYSTSPRQQPGSGQPALPQCRRPPAPVRLPLPHAGLERRYAMTACEGWHRGALYEGPLQGQACPLQR